MSFLLYTLHVLICLFLIAVVLLQQGKGADLSVFGGGATQTAFGARGAASVLHRLTVGSFVGFIVTTLAIGVLQGHEAASLLKDLPEKQVVQPAEPTAEPAGALPTDETATGEAATGETATGDTATGETATGEAANAEAASDGTAAESTESPAAESTGAESTETESPPPAESTDGSGN